MALKLIHILIMLNKIKITCILRKLNFSVCCNKLQNNIQFYQKCRKSRRTQMKNRCGRYFLFLMAVFFITGASAARANWLMPIMNYCDYRSLLDPECLYCENVTNFSRDWPMGASFAPTIGDIWVERQYPYPGENVTVRIKAATSSSSSGNDNLPSGAQYLLWKLGMGSYVYIPGLAINWFSSFLYRSHFFR